MADPGQHQGALFNMAFDPVAHIDKGVARAAHFHSTRRGIGFMPPPAKGFGHLRQTFDRPQLVAQIDEGDTGHQDTEKYRVNKELMWIAGRNTPPVQYNLKRPDVGDQINPHPITCSKINRFEGWHILCEAIRADPP